MSNFSINNVAANLTRCRKEATLTQGELSTSVDVTRMSVSRWERGVQTPSLAKLVLLADALDVTPDDLLRGADG